MTAIAAQLRRLTVLQVVAGATYALGVLARWRYILVDHHPRHFVQSDALPILELAERLAASPESQQFFHTIWPPGMSAFLAWQLRLDPTLGSAALWQFALSCLMPLMIAHAARLSSGDRPGHIALLMASAHFGFIHYGGFFLAEQLFQFAIVAALWMTVLAARVPASRPRWRLLAAGGSGIAWGLAALFRPNALPVAAVVGLWLAARWLRRRDRPALLALGTAGLGLLLVMAPMAHRCSQLLGGFCPGSSNFAMNIALGHAPPDIAGLDFQAQGQDQPGRSSVWVPPARLHHGYQGVAPVPGSIYETGRVLSWVRDRLLEDPVEFAISTVGNVFDLFWLHYWPDDYARLPRRWATVLKQLYLMLVIAPGLVVWGLQLRRLMRRQPVSGTTALLVAGMAGVFLLAAVSLGEPRYRIPFDGLLILLAARGWAGQLDPPAPAPGGRAPAVLAATGGTLLALAAGMLLAAAHPGIGLAGRRTTAAAPAADAPSATGLLGDFARPRPAGSAWNAPGNFVFNCAPTCPRLLIALPALQQAPWVNVSSDHNDRYEMVFYRGWTPVGRVTWGPADAVGLRPVLRNVPAAARAGGYDQIAVRPLYGDGRYSLGHVRFLQHPWRDPGR